MNLVLKVAITVNKNRGMKHLIVAGLLLITFASVQEVHTITGTCASIGYSTACCPPDHDGDCEASDGNCFCGSDCHIFGDCCDDVHCPANPRTCRGVGITSCCSDATGNGLCDVRYRPPDPLGICSCNVTCHLRGDCCSDAVSFCIHPEPVSTDPESVTTDTKPVATTGATFTACAVADVINLISTITDEDYILWPNEEVVFTCETSGLINEWTSDDYLGHGISLIFDYNNNIGDEVQSQTASRSYVELVRIDYNYVMVSQLHITTSSQFPTLTVACTNLNGISKNITFSVLACSQPTPQDGIVIHHIQISQRNDLIIFKCKDGHHPTEELSTLCLQNGTWTMDPNDVCSDIDECSENRTTLCPSGSRCINTKGSYTCVCNEGYFHLQTENLNECEDVDECTFSGINICDVSSHAVCVNTVGSYTCACKTGYKGDGQTCKLFDDSTCDTLCDHHCVHQRNVPPRCVCDRGYYLAQDGITCTDVNECLVPAYSSLCVNAQCRNTNGSFVCICDPGYIADGKNNCVDIDECEDGSHSCVNANCTNTEGSYICTCHESFYNINGITCLVKPNHELEYNIGTDFCVEDPMSMEFSSSITCELVETALPPPEFLWNVTLNGTKLSKTSRNVNIENDTLTLIGPMRLDNTSTLDVICDASNMFGNDSATTSISLCSPTQCQDGITNNCTQVCTRDTNTGVHSCSCYPGYQVDADHDTECSDIEECANGLDNCSSPNWNCKNLMPPRMFTCECNLGFTGDNCGDINECESDSSHHCPPSSMCINTYGSYDCLCVNNTQEDVSGNCTDIDECSESKHNCSKYARCKNFFGGYSCECLSGFKGDGEMCAISEEIIIGTSVSAGLLLVGIILLLIITGSIKVGRRLRSIIRSNETQHHIDIHDYEMNVARGKANEASIDNEDQSGGYMVVRDALLSNFPLTIVIKSANLRVLDPIGQGEFGIVYKGCLTRQYTDEIVAIKTLKGFIDANAIQELLSECAKMKNFDNIHVMSLKGVCLDGGPVPYIVLPYMANGSLGSYLKRERKNLVMMNDNTYNVANDSEIQPQVLIIKKRLMDMCLQVAKGMEYLAGEKVVHRDLAARNCMIDINMVIKVADFGLSVNIGAKEYYRLTKHVDVKLPVKWMAPECLSDYMFSEMSDVWSYGVTCWEIFTGGQSPYAAIRPSAILSFLQGGERLEMPNNSACTDDLYSMMQWCWEMEPDKRPSFSTLVNKLSKSLEKQAGYLRVGAFTTGNNHDSLTDHSCSSSNEEFCMSQQ